MPEHWCCDEEEHCEDGSDEKDIDVNQSQILVSHGHQFAPRPASPRQWVYKCDCIEGYVKVFGGILGFWGSNLCFSDILVSTTYIRQSTVSLIH